MEAIICVGVLAAGDCAAPAGLTNLDSRSSILFSRAVPPEVPAAFAGVRRVDLRCWGLMLTSMLAFRFEFFDGLNLSWTLAQDVLEGRRTARSSKILASSQSSPPKPSATYVYEICRPRRRERQRDGSSLDRYWCTCTIGTAQKMSNSKNLAGPPKVTSRRSHACRAA